MQSIPVRYLNPLLVTTNLLVSGVLLLLTLLLWHMPSASAQSFHENRHSRAYLNGLSNADRTELLHALRDSARNRSNSRDHRLVPQHHYFRAVFIDLLLNPTLAYQLPAADREIIETLPAHNDPQFSTHADRALSKACRMISKLSTGPHGSASGAVQAFGEAQNQIDSQLNAHYLSVLNRLSPVGRQAVTAQVRQIKEDGSLQHGGLDFQELSFIDSDFVLAFLKDTCDNHDRRPVRHDSESRTLRQQMLHDLEAGSVQIFEPK